MNASTVVTLADRVTAGAEFLDRCMPGWAHEVNLVTLDIDDWRGCILGQLFESYSRGTRLLQLSAEKTVNLGFAVTGDDGQEDHVPDKSEISVLNELWCTAIRERAPGRPRQPGKMVETEVVL